MVVDEAGQLDGPKRFVPLGSLCDVLSKLTGDRFDAFVRAEVRGIVAAVVLLTGSQADAEDSVSHALGRAWERLDRGDSIESLRAWVLTVALNDARSRHHRMLIADRAYRRLLAGLNESTTGPGADAIDLARALRVIPRRQREAVILRYWGDLSVAQVAEALGVAEGTAKALLHQARTRLGVALDPVDSTTPVTIRPVSG